jgi:hypothetical protein
MSQWFPQGLHAASMKYALTADGMSIGWVNRPPRRHKVDGLLNLVDCVLFTIARIENFPDRSKKPVQRTTGEFWKYVAGELIAK